MSKFLNLSHVSFSYLGSAEALFEDINIHFARGWTAIVGANGTGKTTLAKIIGREISPDTGHLSGIHSTIYVSQGGELQEEELEHFISEKSNAIGKWKSMLGVNLSKPSEYLQLSEGERRRILLAFHLSKEAEVLILDEPTNHLDEESIMLIKDSIQNFTGIGILISHDEFLLNELCQSTIFINRKSVIQMPCNLENARIELEKLQNATKAEWIHLEKEKKRLLKSYNEKKSEAMSADKRRSKKHIDPKDNDTRAKFHLARLTGKDGTAGKLQNQLNSRIREVEKNQRTLTVKLQRHMEFQLEWKVKSTHKKSFLNLTEKNIKLQTDSRVGITGKNGAGKSVLLKFIVDQLAKQNVSYFYLPQVFTEMEMRKIFHQWLGLSNEKKASILAKFTFLGSDPLRILNSHSYSPGEWKKLFIAIHSEDEFDILLLDEPTNHLDIYANQAIIRSLLAFPAAVVTVSHDRNFLQKVTKEEWKIENFLVSQKHSGQKQSLNLELF